MLRRSRRSDAAPGLAWLCVLAAALLPGIAAAQAAEPAGSRASPLSSAMRDWLRAVCLAPNSARADAPYVLRLAGLAPTGQMVLMGTMGNLFGVPMVDILRAPQGKPTGPARPSDVVQLADAAQREILAGDFGTARQSLQRCVDTATQLSLAEPDAVCSGNLGVMLAQQGEAAAARAQFERSRQRYADWAAELERLAAQPQDRPMMRGPQNARRQQLDTGPRAAAAGQLRAWLNMGNLAAFNGQFERAEKDFQQARAVPQPPDAPPSCNEAAAFDLAHLHHRMGRDDPEDRLPEAGAVSRVSSPHLLFLAPATFVLGTPGAGAIRPADSPGASERSPMARSESVARRSDDALQQMLDSARAEEQAQRREPAMAAYATLALRAAAAGRPEPESVAHGALMKLYADAQQPAAAIYHGKTAVNRLQQVRVGLADGTEARAAQRAYLRERVQLHLRLAQLLLDARRLAEAEQVLQVLKEDEGRQFELDRTPVRPAVLAFGPLETQARETFERAVQALRDSEALLNGESGYAPATRLLRAFARGSAPDEVERQRIFEGRRMKPAIEAIASEAAARQDPRLPPGSGAEAMRMAQLGAQVERFAHLVEDAPRFRHETVPAEELAQWTQLLARASAQLADRRARTVPAPMTASAPPGVRAMDEVWRRLAAGGQALPPESPYERLWRADDAMHRVEETQRRDQAGLPQRLAPGTPPAGAGEDTARLLSRDAPQTVLLYYLPGSERLDILMVGPGGRRHWRTNQTAQQLDRQVIDFVRQLRDEHSNPRPAAEALYRQLVGPVDAALRQAAARTVVLSLVGTMRYLPFAALHDGERWLVERYALALHPGSRMAELLRPASRHWRVSAFGAAGDGADLPGVQRELAAIVRREGPDGVARGVMPGRAWLDSEFTAAALREALEAGAPVVHIASHFDFVGGSASRSSLLLGDGGKLSLAELGGGTYRFDRTELVTLSACNTGLSEADRYGQEVDGLAALLLGRGAPSVLASMWKVNDASTAALMEALYRLHEDETRPLSRAEALQQAQRGFIGPAPRTPATEPAANQRRRAFDRPGDERMPEPEPAGSLGRAHPYHWAPFVLMGGWL